MIPAGLIARFGASALPTLKKWWPAIAAAALFGLLLTLAYCKGESAGKTGEIVKQQDREIEILTEVGEANESAAEARLTDASRIALNEKELTNALTETSDPDTRRALRGCIVMRQQGRDTTGVPACSRPAAGH